ncbi:hypothetical protein CC78DRAFT_529082 [Lojkania enalia]|uniref:Uncharacterized protein n=1 Tax=Lojkania enalia TaxID=147567 RepID=A0A9P4NAY9_9PLEO|nr:hypothetical protein CC78DRAFT_529082 [Didymosphaeria enalia]
MKSWAIGILLSILPLAFADVAPEITTLEEGYGYVAKIPCLGCPFLYQDTSSGKDVPWSSREDDNALLLNVSLTYINSNLQLNGQTVWPSASILPGIHSAQVVQDLSTSDISKLVESGQLETSHETGVGGAFLGLSYHSSIHPLKDSAALVIHFDIFEIYSDLPMESLTHALDDERQKMLEIVLIQKPIMSALEDASYEITKISLIPHPKSPSWQQTMRYLEWDKFGERGTSSHFVSSLSASFLMFLDSGVWALFMFILGVIAVFMVVCMLCILSLEWWQDDYKKAQTGKRRKSSGKRDVEMGKLQFKSPEELGLLGRGRVVGLGKSD